jgi:hypothetical protein
VRLSFTVIALTLASVAVGVAQTPQPFPRSTQPAPKGTPVPQRVSSPAIAAPWGTGPGVPTQETIGVPVYPSAVYITSYDAGRGQRFYLFGTVVPYAEMVIYYKTLLKDKGEELFESPPTHLFETAKFKEDTMAFVPSVTIKDYTYGGSSGYPSTTAGAPERFPTIIQIVPAPSGAK